MIMIMKLDLKFPCSVCNEHTAEQVVSLNDDKIAFFLCKKCKHDLILKLMEADHE